MKYNEETTSTGWTEGGEEMKTYTWRTGPNSLRVRNSVPELGISENLNMRFLPTGVEVWKFKILTFAFILSHRLLVMS